MKIRRTSNPDFSFVDSDGIALWCHGIVEWRVDTCDGRFLLTPIMRDRSEGPAIDATDMHERFLRKQLNQRAAGKHASPTRGWARDGVFTFASSWSPADWRQVQDLEKITGQML